MATTPPDEQSGSENWLSEGNPNTGQHPAYSRADSEISTARPTTNRPSARDEAGRAAAATARALREHAAVVTAVHGLENALASPAIGREDVWKRKAVPALRRVMEAIEAHRKSAEGQGGVISDAEAVLGRPPTLFAARNQHKRLVKDASDLLAVLEERGAQTTIEGIRTRGWRLASALHEHRALEADLIMQAFERDIGGEA